MNQVEAAAKIAARHVATIEMAEIMDHYHEIMGHDVGPEDAEMIHTVLTTKLVRVRITGRPRPKRVRRAVLAEVVIPPDPR